MSLSRLASQAAAGPQRRVPDKELAGPGTVESRSAGGTEARTPRDNFDALTRYIPTETVTLFVAACAAFRVAERPGFGDLELALWVGGILLTPLVLALVAFGRHRQSDSPGPFRLHPWPLVAATVAFAVWALSVPGVLEGDLGLPAAFGALFVSTMLSLLEPVFGPRPA